MIPPYYAILLLLCFFSFFCVEQAMVAANAGRDEGLQSLLDSLQDDSAIFTKPAEASGGRPVYLAL